ncbi:MAG: hypothetical protein IJS22_07570 [Lachnospiraceae bacterium]|nr:hypothetical protein [Lachnospiraceae bacterium]
MAKGTGHRRISIGVILFALVLIYLSYHMISYLTREKVSVYTVGEEVTLTRNPTYTGLILRSERLIPSESSGYVNYYVENGGRCSTTNVIYSIDENGSFNNLLASRAGTSGLSTENLSQLTSTLSQFSLGYDPAEFDDVYTLKDNLEYRLLSFLNINSAEGLESLGISETYFHTYSSDHIGIVEYYSDGYEGFVYTDITAEDFDTEKYQKKNYRSGEAVSAGSPVYKLIDSESWSVVVPLSEQDADDLKDAERVNVTFNESGISTTVLFEEFTGSDGGKYGIMTLSKYMIQYAESRYLSVTIEKNAQQGLKIPVSAVTSKDFFVIPLEYIAKGGNTDSEGFFTETVTVDGTTAKFVEAEIFFRDDTYAYVPKDQLDLGSIVVMPDSQERFAVSAVKPLPGVLSVNKGYAVFKVIIVIDQDEEYYIVRRGTSYGISARDNILLDGSSALEGEKIY